MKRIDMNKAYAELEGVKVELWGGVNLRVVKPAAFNKITGVYDPVGNGYLNVSARDDYKVEIDYDESKVFILGAFFEGAEVINVDMTLDHQPSRAVIECILKFKGKWVE